MLVKSLLPLVVVALAVSALPLDPADTPAGLAIDRVSQAIHPSKRIVNPKNAALGVASIPKNKAQKIVQGRQEEPISGAPQPTSTTEEPPVSTTEPERIVTSVPEEEEGRLARRVSPGVVTNKPAQVKGVATGKASQAKNKVPRSPVDPMFVPETVVGAASGVPPMIIEKAPGKTARGVPPRVVKNAAHGAEHKAPIHPPVNPVKRADDDSEDKPETKPKQDHSPTRVPVAAAHSVSGKLPVKPPVPGRRQVPDEDESGIEGPEPVEGNDGSDEN